MKIFNFELESKLDLHLDQRQHLSAAKNRKLCGAALALKGELCGRVRRKLSNCAAKSRQIFTKCAVIVRHFQLIFGSNWQQLCINNVVGRPDQTSEHQKQKKNIALLGGGFRNFVKFELTKNQRLVVLFKHTLNSKCHVIRRFDNG